ncbi:MAG: hypothetical protein R2932_54445 [Caldilineaceae bacterium]
MAIGGALLCFSFALTLGQDVGYGSPGSWFDRGALLFAVVFIRIEQYVTHPMVVTQSLSRHSLCRQHGFGPGYLFGDFRRHGRHSLLFGVCIGPVATDDGDTDVRVTAGLCYLDPAIGYPSDRVGAAHDQAGIGIVRWAWA